MNTRIRSRPPNSVKFSYKAIKNMNISYRFREVPA